MWSTDTGGRRGRGRGGGVGKKEEIPIMPPFHQITLISLPKTSLTHGTNLQLTYLSSLLIFQKKKKSILTSFINNKISLTKVIMNVTTLYAKKKNFWFSGIEAFPVKKKKCARADAHVCWRAVLPQEAAAPLWGPREPKTFCCNPSLKAPREPNKPVKTLRPLTSQCSRPNTGKSFRGCVRYFLFLKKEKIYERSEHIFVKFVLSDVQVAFTV